MLLTTSTVLIFIGIAVFSLFVGLFSSRNEIYFLGVVLLLFTGLMILQNDISEPSGSIINESVSGSVVTTTYSVFSSAWVNGLGLLLVVIAAGLSLHFVAKKEDDQRKKRDRLDIDDD